MYCIKKKTPRRSILRPYIQFSGVAISYVTYATLAQQVNPSHYNSILHDSRDCEVELGM